MEKGFCYMIWRAEQEGDLQYKRLLEEKLEEYRILYRSES